MKAFEQNLKLRQSLDLALRASIYGLLLLLATITLVPLLWLLVGSFKLSEDFFATLFFPAGEGLFGIDWGRLGIHNYRRLLLDLGFANHILNSLFIASVTSLLATLFAALGGYSLAKFHFRGKSFVLAVVLLAIILPAPLVLAPVYQLLYHLGMLNSYLGLILPAMTPAFGIFLFRQAMLNSVPKELIESARIDGCGEFRIFFVVVLPIIRPMVGAFLLINFLSNWNNFILPQVILQDSSKFPLSVAIAQLRGSFHTDYAMIAAGTIVSILPIMILFLMLQREFISGLTSGAVKG